MFGRLLGWCNIYTFGALSPQRNFARCKIHFASKSCVLIYWQRYCTTLYDLRTCFQLQLLLFQTPIFLGASITLYFRATLVFCTTVCKTVRPMSSDRCPVCLSVLSATLVYCGQTGGRIKMKLGMQVDLSPGHIVLNGNPAPPKGAQPPPLIFGPYL